MRKRGSILKQICLLLLAGGLLLMNVVMPVMAADDGEMPLGGVFIKDADGNMVYIEIIAQVSDDIAIPVGGSTVLNAQAVDGQASYNWEVSSDRGDTWKAADGANDRAEYSITEAKQNDPAALPYLYRVTVTNSDGLSVAETIRVLVYNDFTYTELKDSATGVAVKGFFHNTAELAVVTLAPYRAATELQNAIREGYAPLAAYELALLSADSSTDFVYTDMLRITLPTGAEYNDTELNVYQQYDGAKTLTAKAANGSVAVNTDRVGQFVVEVPGDTLHNIVITHGANGDVSPNAIAYIEEGGSCTFVFTPHTGYIVDEVKLDGSPVAINGNSYTIANIKSNHLLEVTFRLPPAQDKSAGCSITAPATIHGNISPAGSFDADYGESVTVYFYPDEGYTVDKLLVNDVEWIAGANCITLTVTEDTEIKVEFRELTNIMPIVTRIVKASAGSGGSISPAGETKVLHGGDLYLTFIPNEGYVVDEVTVDGLAVEAVSGWHMLCISADRNINVTFRKAEADTEPTQYHILKVSSSDGGSISPSGEIMLAEGCYQTFYVFPDEGYEFGYLRGMNKLINFYANSYTVEGIGEDEQLVAEFLPIDTNGNGSDCDCALCSIWHKLFKGAECRCPWCWITPVACIAVIAGVIIILIVVKKRPRDSGKQ